LKSLGANDQQKPMCYIIKVSSL